MIIPQKRENRRNYRGSRTTAPEKSGRGASVAFGTLAIVALLGTAIVFKKR